MASIGPYLNGLLEEYIRYRANNHRCPDFKPFWDVVVITTLDQLQQQAFQEQIEDKRRRGELPGGLPVHVVPDPPGCRIGNGGSTMAVLEFLERHYGTALYTLKIFLIHAGGWCQRMPSATVLGKIFSILPCGNPPIQMLDLKLAFYWPFVEKLQPGVFLGSSDDFSIHDLGSDSTDWFIPGKGFTALAHPSPMRLGRAHGVYVVKGVEDVDFTKRVVRRECLEVLQKPNDEKMVSHGAVLRRGSSATFGDGIRITHGDVVYTDSCFYFGADVVEKLLRLKKSIGELSCEIDAFGDILQSVGERAKVDYVYDTSNVSRVTESLLETRRRVFETLKGSDINVLLLNASAYVHIGTTKELLYHLCRDDVFRSRVNFKKAVFNRWTKEENEPFSEKSSGNEVIISNTTTNTSTTTTNTNNESVCYKGVGNVSEYSCTVHSSLRLGSKIGPDSYIEFCDFRSPVNVLGGSILSNCLISGVEDAVVITIPDNVFLHTIPIRPGTRAGIVQCENDDDIGDDNKRNGDEGAVTEYVTIILHIYENTKKTVPVSEVGSLDFNGSDIDGYLSQRCVEVNDIIPCGYSGRISLWDLKLYPSFKSMTSSVLDAIDVKRGHKVNLRETGNSPFKLYSMSDLLRVKDVGQMLAFRRNLYDKIMLET